MKLPHYAQLLLGLLVVVITWVMQQASSGALVLPAIAITVLTIVKTAIGMLTDSPSTMAKLKAASLVTKTLVCWLGIAAGCFFLGTILACQACSPPTPAVIAPTVDTVLCILTTYATDEAGGMQPIAIIADVGAKCNADAQTIASVWGAHVHAAIVDPSPKVMPLLDGGK